VKAAPEKSTIQFATQHPGLGWISMWLSRAQVEDLQTSFEFELVKNSGGAMRIEVPNLGLILRSIAKRCVSKDGDAAPCFETRTSCAPQHEVREMLHGFLPLAS